VKHHFKTLTFCVNKAMRSANHWTTSIFAPHENTKG